MCRARGRTSAANLLSCEPTDGREVVGRRRELPIHKVDRATAHEVDRARVLACAGARALLQRVAPRQALGVPCGPLRARGTVGNFAEFATRFTEIFPKIKARCREIFRYTKNTEPS